MNLVKKSFYLSYVLNEKEDNNFLNFDWYLYNYGVDKKNLNFYLDNQFIFWNNLRLNNKIGFNKVIGKKWRGIRYINRFSFLMIYNNMNLLFRQHKRFWNSTKKGFLFYGVLVLRYIESFKVIENIIEDIWRSYERENNDNLQGVYRFNKELLFLVAKRIDSLNSIYKSLGLYYTKGVIGSEFVLESIVNTYLCVQAGGRPFITFEDRLEWFNLFNFMQLRVSNYFFFGLNFGKHNIYNYFIYKYRGSFLKDKIHLVVSLKNLQKHAIKSFDWILGDIKEPNKSFRTILNYNSKLNYYESNNFLGVGKYLTEVYKNLTSHLIVSGKKRTVYKKLFNNSFYNASSKERGQLKLDLSRENKVRKTLGLSEKLDKFFVNSTKSVFFKLKENFIDNYDGSRYIVYKSLVKRGNGYKYQNLVLYTIYLNLVATLGIKELNNFLKNNLNKFLGSKFLKLSTYKYSGFINNFLTIFLRLMTMHGIKTFQVSKRFKKKRRVKILMHKRLANVYIWLFKRLKGLDSKKTIKLFNVYKEIYFLFFFNKGFLSKVMFNFLFFFFKKRLGWKRKKSVFFFKVGRIMKKLNKKTNYYFLLGNYNIKLKNAFIIKLFVYFVKNFSKVFYNYGSFLYYLKDFDSNLKAKISYQFSNFIFLNKDPFFHQFGLKESVHKSKKFLFSSYMLTTLERDKFSYLRAFFLKNNSLWLRRYYYYFFFYFYVFNYYQRFGINYNILKSKLFLKFIYLFLKNWRKGDKFLNLLIRETIFLLNLRNN